MQIAHPSFLRWTLPALEGKQVRLAHTRPAFENVSLHGDVFSQVSTPLLAAASGCHILKACWPGAVQSHTAVPSALQYGTVHFQSAHSIVAAEFPL